MKTEKDSKKQVVKRFVLNSMGGVAPTITSHIAKDGVYNLTQKGAYRGVAVVEMVREP